MRKFKKSYYGIVFVIFMVFMVTSMLLVKTEMKNVAQVKSRLKAASNAGALAGAQMADIDEYENSGEKILRPDLAKQVGIQIARENLKYNLQNYDDSEIIVTSHCEPSDSDPRYLVVESSVVYKPYYGQQLLSGFTVKESWKAEPVIIK